MGKKWLGWSYMELYDGCYTEDTFERNNTVKRETLQEVVADER